eukprot:1925383-Amphidinium_carterae.1
MPLICSALAPLQEEGDEPEDTSPTTSHANNHPVRCSEPATSLETPHATELPSHLVMCKPTTSSTYSEAFPSNDSTPNQNKENQDTSIDKLKPSLAVCVPSVDGAEVRHSGSIAYSPVEKSTQFAMLQGTRNRNRRVSQEIRA